MAAHELLSNPHSGAAKGGEEEKRGREGKRKGKIVRHLDGKKKKKRQPVGNRKSRHMDKHIPLPSLCPNPV